MPNVLQKVDVHVAKVAVADEQRVGAAGRSGANRRTDGLPVLRGVNVAALVDRSDRELPVSSPGALASCPQSWANQWGSWGATHTCW